MNLHRTTLAATTTLAGTLLTTALLGPNPQGNDLSVTAVELHEALIEALDQGDAAAVRELMVESPLLFVVDQEGRPATLNGEHSVDDLVSIWAADVEDAEPTTMVSCTVIADGPDSCAVVFELERPTSALRRFRGTSVVTKSQGQGCEEFKLQHLHVSTADREDY